MVMKWRVTEPPPSSGSHRASASRSACARVPLASRICLGSPVSASSAAVNFGRHPVARGARSLHRLDFCAPVTDVNRRRRVLDVAEQLVDVAQEHQHVGAQRRRESARDGVGVAVERFGLLVEGDGTDDGREAGRPQGVEHAPVDQRRLAHAVIGFARRIRNEATPASASAQPDAREARVVERGDDAHVDVTQRHHDVIHGLGVGDAKPVLESALEPDAREQFGDLRTPAVDDRRRSRHALAVRRRRGPGRSTRSTTGTANPGRGRRASPPRSSWRHARHRKSQCLVATVRDVPRLHGLSRRALDQVVERTHGDQPPRSRRRRGRSRNRGCCPPGPSTSVAHRSRPRRGRRA